MATTLNRAGGYRVIRGSTRYPNLTFAQRKPWLAACRAHLKRKLKANDWSIRTMLEHATRTLSSLEASSPNRTGCGKVGSPAVRAATLIAHIIRQGLKPVLPTDKGPKRARYTAQDVLIVALAVQIQCRYDGDIAIPPMSHRPYFVACQVGRAIHHYLRRESRTYTRDDGRGNVWEETVTYRRLALQSRYVCQELEKLVNECAGVDFVRGVNGRAIADRVTRQQLRRYHKLNAREALQYSRSVQSSLA